MSLDKFKNIPFKEINKCEACQSEFGLPAISLPNYPLTEIMTKEMLDEPVGFVDQKFHLCEHCGHGQLSNIIPQDVLYSDYFFRTSNSAATSKGNESFRAFIEKNLGSRALDTIVEIGCNDLNFLSSLKPIARRLVGIDPVLRGQEIRDEKITAVGDFFENVDLKNYMSQQGNTLVLSSHNLEHIENPRLMIQKLLENSGDKTLFTLQFPCLDTLVEESRFDQIFHHHLHYFSVNSFATMLNSLGGEITDCQFNRSYWGSLLVAFKKSGKNMNNLPGPIEKEQFAESYDLFRRRMDLTKRHLRLLHESREKIYGYGSILTLPVLNYALDNALAYCGCIIDDDKSKEGMYHLAFPIETMPQEKVGSLEDASIVITAINHTRPIFKRLVSLNPKRIILPTNSV